MLFPDTINFDCVLQILETYLEIMTLYEQYMGLFGA